MFLLAVIVTSDSTATDIDARTHIRIADILQMRELRAFADVGILDFDEVADFDVFANRRTGSDMDVRSKGNAVANLGFVTVAELCGNAVANLHIGKADIRTDNAVLANNRIALNVAVRINDRVLPDLNVNINESRIRVDNRYARFHKGLFLAHT